MVAGAAPRSKEFQNFFCSYSQPNLLPDGPQRKRTQVVQKDPRSLAAQIPESPEQQHIASSLPRLASFPRAARVPDSTDELYIAEQKRNPSPPTKPPSLHGIAYVRNLHFEEKEKKKDKTWTVKESRVHLASSLCFCYNMHIVAVVIFAFVHTSSISSATQWVGLATPA